MAISDSYGERFGKRLGAQATAFTTRAMPGDNMIAVTELRYENPQHILSTPPVVEDAFVIGVHLKTFENYQYWRMARPLPGRRWRRVRPSSMISSGNRPST